MCKADANLNSEGGSRKEKEACGDGAAEARTEKERAEASDTLTALRADLNLDTDFEILKGKC